MVVVLAVDPGVKKAGWALFVNGVLRAGGTAIGRDAFSTSSEIVDVIEALHVLPDRVVIEKMRKYTGRGETHKDLDRVEVMAKALGKAARTMWNAPTKRVYPSDWKGNVPKDVCQRRVERTLTHNELDSMHDFGHDAMDAVGVGLVAVGRLKRGLV